MARFILSCRSTCLAAGLLVSFAWSVSDTYAQTTYNFVNPSNGTFLDWHDNANWDPTGFPNAAGDAAIFTRVTGTPGDAFTIATPFGEDTTVGSITIDSSGNTDNVPFAIDGGPIVFQTTSGPAALTATADGGSGNSDRLTIWNDVSVLSDLVATFDHKSNLNSSTFVNGIFTGATDRTITKEGLANMEMKSHGAAGFQGQYVINNGAIRFLGNSNFVQSTGISVNSGGQLQINVNETAATYDWSLAAGAAVELNGTGKSGGSARGGALRFQGQANQSATHARFNVPVELQTDTEIAAGPATVTGEITGVVSGAGGLTKSAPGILTLSNAGNSYAGSTTVGDGTFSITNPFLSDVADVSVGGAATLNLNFSDTDNIRSLFIGGDQMEAGLWGATGNAAAEFQTDRITGFGLLQVAVGPGLLGDFNEDGFVNAADYVTWRKNNGTENPLPNDNDLGTPIGSQHYELWEANFGNSSASESASFAAATSVPEPSASLFALIALGTPVIAPLRRRAFA